jgi:predicted dehydrogenase
MRGDKVGLRWAILGTGNIAKKFALGLRSSPGNVALAAGSRSLERARAFAGGLKIERPYGSYDEMVADPDVEAVYVATPPGRHRDDALRCIEAGKHVLVEKPFALDAAQGREVVEAAGRRGVFCMEAMWTRFLPAVRLVKSMVTEGRLGEIQLMTGTFGFAETLTEGHWMADPAQGGGALMDRGVYPISLALHFAGAAPDSIVSAGALGPTGVDEQVSAILRFGTSTMANVSATLRANDTNDFRILGTEGSVHLHAPIFRPFRITIAHYQARRSGEESAPATWKDNLRESKVAHRLMQRAQGLRDAASSVESRTVPYEGNGYGHEADEVARCVAAHKLESRVMPHEQTIAVLETLDAIRAQMRGEGGQ